MADAQRWPSGRFDCRIFLVMTGFFALVVRPLERSWSVLVEVYVRAVPMAKDPVTLSLLPHSSHPRSLI